jgi:3,4-dihydroxy 2-butanone 4-phosphate synthase/GTP cyclohydrolase II
LSEQPSPATPKKARKARPAASPFATVEEAIAEFQRGHAVIITDDEDRENEGDLCLPAQFTTPDDINFMAKHGRGLICTALSSERIDQLGLPMMVDRNTAPLGTAFTISVEAKAGVSTGISAGDRARTVHVLIDPNTTARDLVSPGHMFPLRARDGGVLVRAGQTEASVDLCRMAGLLPGAVICEIMKADGTMARQPELARFAKRHGIKMISIEQIIRYRLRTEQHVERITEANLPTRFGYFRVIGYRVPGHPEEHAALVLGDVSTPEPSLVRVHSQCLTGDVFSSLRCDCGEQLDIALELIGKEGRGAFVYMQQEGRGIGLHNKLRAYALQDKGLDTVEANVALGFAADRRDYGIGMQILRDLGISRIRLLTNNPAKRHGLSAYGLEVVERVPVIARANPHNAGYLAVKQAKLGHLFDAPVAPPVAGAAAPEPPQRPDA